MADYVGSAYDTGTGDVISAIQRPSVVSGQPQQNFQQQPVQQQPAPQYGQADDLINNAISARQNIEAQRQALAANLSGSHPRAWKEGIVQQIKGLDQASRGVMQDAALSVRMRMAEATQARIGAHDQATMAASALRNDREHSIDEQGAALMTGLGQLDAMHRNGDISNDQYDAGLLDLGQQYGLGLRHPEAGKMYDHFVTEADRRNQFNLRRTASEASKVGARYGIDMQLDENGQPSIEATKQAALQTPRGRDEFLKGMNDELYQKYGNPLGVGSLFNPIAPHTSPDNGKTINLPYADKKTGKLAAMNVPADTFNQMKGDFQDRYFSVFPKQGVTVPNTGGITNSQVDVAGPSVGNNGLQQGATRNVGGKDYSWNGKSWEAQ